MSAYTSIKNVVYDSLSFLNYLVPEQFDNLNQIKGVKVPILLIHGEQDDIVGHHHSKELFAQIRDNHPCNTLVIRKKMKHNEFDQNSDLIRPLFAFMHELKFEQVREPLKI